MLVFSGNPAPMRFLAVHFGGNRSSRPKVISPEVISPGTRVMSPEIHSHVARNPKSCRPQVISPETRVMSPEIYSHVARYFEYFEYDSKSLFNVKAYQYVSKAHDYYFDVKSIIIAHLL